MTRMIALLRAVNVGKRRLPMAELRALAETLGFEDAQTHVASGNLVFTAGEHDPTAVAERLEAAIAKHYGWKSEAIVRTAAQWAKYAGGSPFPDAETERARLLHILVSQEAPAADAVDRLRARAAPEERIATKAGAIWIDFSSGVARSKLTPGFIDMCIGSPCTARNWATVLKLKGLAEA